MARWRGLLLTGVLVCLAGCSYDVSLGSVAYPLPATTCGTWDSTGVHTTGGYVVGHLTDAPVDTIAYFVFDLTPLRGRTVVTASLTIPGTSDWKIVLPDGGETPPLQFMLQVKPLPPSLTLSQVTDGGNDPSVYADVAAERDLGFDWVPAGNVTRPYGAFTYDTVRLQNAVNAGGLYPMFAVQGYGEADSTEEYLFGGGVCSPEAELTVTVE
jgi:hypothetical protein